MEPKLESLRNLATEVGSGLAAVDEANADALAQEVQALNRLMEVVKRGLRPTERITKSKRVHNCNGNCHHDTQYEEFLGRGTYICDLSRSQRGSLTEGTSIDRDLLYWTGEGWAEVTRTGHESNWQGAWWGYDSTLVQLTPEQVVEKYGFLTLMDAIQQVLEERQKKLSGTVKAAQDRLARIQRVQDVLRSR